MISNASNNPESYVKWLLVFLLIMEEKKLGKQLVTSSKSLKKVLKNIKKFSTVPKNESMEQKAEQELEVTAAKVRSAEAKAKRTTTIGACYDLFCQLLVDEPQVQWDHIVIELRTKDPWMGWMDPSTKEFV